VAWITNIEARAAPRRRGHDTRRGNPPARSGQHCPSGHRYRWSPPRRCRRLAAGHDLLQMHFATSSTSPQAADSPWAPVISSPAARAALLSELAGCAQQLAPLPVLLSQQVPANGATTPALGAASEWLQIASSAVGTASLQQPTRRSCPHQKQVCTKPAMLYTTLFRWPVFKPFPATTAPPMFHSTPCAPLLIRGGHSPCFPTTCNVGLCKRQRRSVDPAARLLLTPIA